MNFYSLNCLAFLFVKQLLIYSVFTSKKIKIFSDINLFLTLIKYFLAN